MSTAIDTEQSSRRRILFVDDEQLILKGLQRMLRPYRREWEMEFECDPARAMARIETEAFDVIISDMRMPQIDGAQLLDHARSRRPEAVRIVLSGQAERNATLRAVTPAHQYLAKPCDPDGLRSVVERAFALRKMVADESVTGVVNDLPGLPSAPNLYFELVDELRSTHTTLRKVSQIVARDPAMNAKVLQLVNSAFFGPPRPIVNVQQAVNMLGTDTLQAVVLGIQVFSAFEGKARRWFDVEEVWRSSIITGLIARDIGKAADLPTQFVEHALAGGLLRQLGRLVFAVSMRDRYRNVVARVAEGEIGLVEAEREEFLTTHAAVGAYILGLWGLPEPLVGAVGFHLDPLAAGPDRLDSLGCLHLAAALHDELSAAGDVPPICSLSSDYLEAVGMANRLSEFRALALARFPKANHG